MLADHGYGSVASGYPSSGGGALLWLALPLGIALLLWLRPQSETADSGPAAGTDPTTATEQPGPESETDEQRRVLSSKAPTRSITKVQAALTAFAALRAALAAGEPADRAAAALRRHLRSDPAALSSACQQLLAPGLAADARASLALVLGTIGGAEVDAALLALLASEGMADFVLVAAMHGLGAQREPVDDDEVFDLADRPFGVRGPGGLGVTVRRRIRDEKVLLACSRTLFDRQHASLRSAAVVVLMHSLIDNRVRRDFRSALGYETLDMVASGLGEALAQWARTATGTEAIAVLDELLARAGTAGFDGYRFRLEDDLRVEKLSPQALRTLHSYLDPATPEPVRSWAVEVLGRNPKSAHLLHRVLRQDRQPAIRDAAARLLGRSEPKPATIQVLAQALREDPAWRVRYAALQSLARARDHSVPPLLRAATEDRDTRVAKRARELLAAWSLRQPR